MLGLVRLEEALVEIVDEIRCSPVELSSDSGHGRCRKARHHQPFPWRRQMVDEGVNVAGFLVDEIRIKDHRRQPRHYPWPWPDCVVRDLEVEGRQHAVALAARGENPLRDVTTTPRLGAGIPCGPPLDGQKDSK